MSVILPLDLYTLRGETRHIQVVLSGTATQVAVSAEMAAYLQQTFAPLPIECLIRMIDILYSGHSAIGISARPGLGPSQADNAKTATTKIPTRGSRRSFL